MRNYLFVLDLLDSLRKGGKSHAEVIDGESSDVLELVREPDRLTRHDLVGSVTLCRTQPDSGPQDKAGRQCRQRDPDQS